MSQVVKSMQFLTKISYLGTQSIQILAFTTEATNCFYNMSEMWGKCEQKQRKSLVINNVYMNKKCTKDEAHWKMIKKTQLLNNRLIILENSW